MNTCKSLENYLKKLDVCLKTIFVVHTSYFEKIKIKNKEQFSWDLFCDGKIKTNNAFFKAVSSLLNEIRNYNAHHSHKIIEFKNIFEKISLIPQNSPILIFFKELTTSSNDQKKTFVNNWSLILFYSSLILYSWQYQDIKNQILNILNNDKENKFYQEWPSQLWELFDENFQSFQKLNFKIVKRLSFEKKNEKLSSILNEIVSLTRDQEKETKYQDLSKVTLRKLVTVFDFLINSEIAQEKKINLKIKYTFYCQDCQKEAKVADKEAGKEGWEFGYQNSDKSFVSLADQKKKANNFLLLSIIKCQNFSYCQKELFLNSETEKDFSKWYLDFNSNDYWLRKNFLFFTVDNNLLKISFKTLKTLLLTVLLQGFNEEEKLEILPIKKKLTTFFNIDFAQINDLSILKSFSQNSNQKLASDFKSLKSEKLIELFQNRDFIKKYDFLEDQKKWNSYDFLQPFKILQFIYKRKKLQKYKLKKFNDNLIKQIFDKNEKRNYANFNNLVETKDYREIGLRIKLILNFINAYFNYQSQPSLLLTKKDYQEVYNWVFQKIFNNELEFKLLTKISSLIKQKNILEIFQKISNFTEKNRSEKEIKNYKFDDLLSFLLEIKIKILEEDLNLLKPNLEVNDFFQLSEKIQNWINNFRVSIFKINNIPNNKPIKINHKWLSFNFSHESFLAKKVKSIWPSLKSEYPNEVLESIKSKKDCLKDDFSKKYDLLLRFVLLKFLEKYFATYGLKFSKSDFEFDLEIKEDALTPFIKREVYLTPCKEEWKNIKIVFSNWKEWRNKKNFIFSLFSNLVLRFKWETCENLFTSLNNKFENSTQPIKFKDFKSHWNFLFSTRKYPALKKDVILNRKTIMKFFLKKEEEIFFQNQKHFQDKETEEGYEGYIEFEVFLQKLNIIGPKKIDLLKFRNVIMHNNFKKTECIKPLLKSFFNFFNKEIVKISEKSSNS